MPEPVQPDPARGADGRRGPLWSQPADHPVKHKPLRVEYLHHTLGHEACERIIADFKLGEVDILIGDRMVCRGIDSPWCKFSLSFREADPDRFESLRVDSTRSSSRAPRHLSIRPTL